MKNILIILLSVCIGHTQEVWPPIPSVDQTIISQAVTGYRTGGYDWRNFARFKYQPSGDYLNWSRWWKNGKPDSNGVQQVTYDGGATWVYNPVTIAQTALGMHSLHVKGGELDPRFKVQADFLMGMQGADGAVRYQFSYQGIPSGWVSAMAQGQSISVWTRAFKLFGDTNYLAAAKKAYDFMLIPAAQGGTMGNLGDLHPSLAGYRMLKEYPVSPDLYVLNGSVFSLFGIYDWTEFEPESMSVLNELATTIKRVLPYYQGSSYNLNYLTYPRPLTIVSSYILVNTMLVWNLDQILPEIGLKKFWQEWSAMVDQPHHSPKLRIRLEDENGAVITGANTNSVLVFSSSLSGQWIDLPKIGAELKLPTSDPAAFFVARSPFPVIELKSRNGSLDRWVNDTTPETWIIATGGGTVTREVSEFGTVARMDISTFAMTGIRQRVLEIGKSYRAEFWLKASVSETPIYVYFGTSGAPIATLKAGTEWQKFTASGKATNTADDFAIYCRAPGTIVWIDDVVLFED